MANYHDIRYDMTLSSSTTGGGSMILLETQTASSSATIDFTSGIDDTYKEYIFKIINAHPATDNVYFSFQTDTGTNTNYNQTITSTCFHAFQNEAGTSTGLAYEGGNDQAQGTAFQRLAQTTGNDNDQSCSGTLHIVDPSNTTFVKHFMYTGNNSISNEYTMNEFYAGYFNTTTALTRVRFKFSSGNVDAGTFKLYGVL